MEFQLACLRWGNRHLPWKKRRYQRFRGRHGLLVQLGSGSYIQPGWINIDCYPYSTVDLIGDLNDPLPFDTASVKAIFTEHFLEHLPYKEACRLLSECHRVLAPGGRLRIVVPDGEKILKAYAAGDRWLLDIANSEEWRIVRSEIGRPFATPMEVVNEVCRQSGEHKFLYDFETLALILASANFSKIERSSLLTSPLPELQIDQKWRGQESLYVEAIR